ncbi:hypothetical protein JJB07_20485 [Tumebacillus sp. ITR2]|uniref:Uncharacterized protein n=1 Tax=Tumebacillus amylolyticus TaxID=2801339 RepID=A0ABS1JFF0_9BACL|nr:hypothetical protein [Tumebacillus amylolyticus]MBL0388977.1 hypothetical protein [Tumebacillus amylolyticus]
MATREHVLWREISAALVEAPNVTKTLVEAVRERAGLRSGLLVRLSGEAAGSVEKKKLGCASAALELLELSLCLQEETSLAGMGVRPLEQFRVADFLYAKGLRMATELPTDVAREILDEACRLKSDRLPGRDLDWGEHVKDSEHAELEQAYRKWGRFAGVCCKVGAMLGRCEEEIREALIEYGYCVGMAVASEAGSAVFYRKKAVSCLSALPESEAKSLLLAVPDAFMLGKGREFLDV